MALFLHLVDAAGNQITGGSTNPNAGGDIEVLGWSWGAAFLPYNFQDLTIKKKFDIATVPLLIAANSGWVLSGSLLNIDDTGITVQRVDLEGVTVQLVEIAGVPAPPPPSEESVTLRYNLIRFYTPNGQDGYPISRPVT